jgi:hypothetical protein
MTTTPDDVAWHSDRIERCLRDDTAEAHAELTPHVLWIIEHAPESDWADHPGLLHEPAPADLDRARGLWLAHVEANPRNPTILAHAARFFLPDDRNRAEQLLERAVELEPDDPNWRRRLAHLHDLVAHDAAPSIGAAKTALGHHEAALARTANARERYCALPAAAEAARRAGETAQARAYAVELLDLAGSLSRDWNHGNAIHDGHRILGHLALLDGDVARARQHLLAAGATPGSPQLNSFGPELTLANDLLAAGERDAVLEYLALCERFWEHRASALRRWRSEIEAGGTPELHRFAVLGSQP